MKKVFILTGVVAVSFFCGVSAMAFQNSPVGWASYNDLGCNGTTGGAGGPVYTVTNEADFATYASSITPGPLTVQVQGTINLTARVDISPNKTIIGIGTNPTLTGYNIRIRGQDSGGKVLGYNIIVRNLILRNHSGGDSDGITIQDKAHHVWVDHCDFSTCSDGACDISHACDYITVSWNRFHDQDKTCLLGHSPSNGAEDIGHLKVTYHHNYFGATQRQPRVRFSFLTHVYNNYYVAPADPTNNYGIASTCNAYVLAEGNYFQNMKHPMYSILYSGDPNGWLIERNNIYDPCSGTPEINPPPSMPEPSAYYSYTLDNPNDIPKIVSLGAGIDGIDFFPHWLFGYYGDFNRNGWVMMNDLAQFTQYWMVTDCNAIRDADYNGDCNIDFYEFALFSGNWLKKPVDSTIPAAPSGLWASPGDGSVSLDWDDNTESDLAGYNIYRSTTSGSGYSKLNGSLLNSSNYVDNDVTNGTTYYYVVTAVDTYPNESPYSSQVYAIPGSGGQITTLTIEENTTGFCSVDGAVESEWPGYMGTGYANTINALGKGVNWRISVPSSGTYTFVWRYALASGNRTANLIANGTTILTGISFPASGATTTYIETSPLDASLTAGINNLRLEATTVDGLANIDDINITGINPQAAGCQ
jgi:pectate lyase